MTLVVNSTADEMRQMSDEIDLIRQEVTVFQSSELKMNTLKALDVWRQDLDTRGGVDKVTFFETIPYFDRLLSIRGLLVMLREQAHLTQSI